MLCRDDISPVVASPSWKLVIATPAMTPVDSASPVSQTGSQRVFFNDATPSGVPKTDEVSTDRPQCKTKLSDGTRCGAKTFGE